MPGSGKQKATVQSTKLTAFFKAKPPPPKPSAAYEAGSSLATMDHISDEAMMSVDLPAGTAAATAAQAPSSRTVTPPAGLPTATSTAASRPTKQHRRAGGRSDLPSTFLLTGMSSLTRPHQGTLRWRTLRRTHGIIEEGVDRPYPIVPSRAV